MGNKTIELTDEQKQFITNHFVYGERLFNRVEEFDEEPDVVTLTIQTKDGHGIAPYRKTYPSLSWISCYPKYVVVEFSKNPLEEEES